MSAPAPRRAAFIFIFATVALDMLALGVMVPVLPKLVVEFEGGDVARASMIVGLFGFAWAAMQFLFQPVLGAASDRFGRRPVVLLSNLGLGLDYVFMALAPSLPWLFVGRLISGVTSASVATASAYIADITPAEYRAARFGMLGAAFGLGFIIGPAVGGWLGAIDLRLPFWCAAGLSLLNFFYGLVVLPESLPLENRSKAFKWRVANVAGGLALLRSRPVLVALGVATFLHQLAHESLPGIFVLYTDTRYGWDAAMTGTVLALIGVASTIVSGAVVRPAVKRLGEWRAAFAGLGFGIVYFAIFGLAPTSAIFLASIPFGALWGLAGPAEQALMSKEAGPESQGLLQGAIGSLRGVSGMIGPILFTQVFATSVAGQGFLGTAYLLACGLIALSLVAVVVGRRSAV